MRPDSYFGLNQHVTLLSGENERVGFGEIQLCDLEYVHCHGDVPRETFRHKKGRSGGPNGSKPSTVKIVDTG